MVETPWVEGVIKGIVVEDAGMKEDFVIEDGWRSWSSARRDRGRSGEGEQEGVFLCPGRGDPDWLGGVRNMVVIEDWDCVEGDCGVRVVRLICLLWVGVSPL